MKVLGNCKNGAVIIELSLNEQSYIWSQNL